MNTAAHDATLPGRDRSESPLRFVTAASLFDGHDAAINIVRRLLQSNGAEVIHLGHNRAVADIVRAALQEDADAIACSSYQGGHNEYFRYMIDLLREADAMVMEGLERHGIYDEIWQCPTVLVPLQLSGSEGEMIVLRPIRSSAENGPGPAPRAPSADGLRARPG